VRAGNYFLALPIVFLAALLGACGDATGVGANPNILQDTVLLAAPSQTNSALPSALDVLSNGGAVGGVRFPERPEDAEQWDVAIRLRGGELFFAPPASLGFTNFSLRRAGITDPITDQSFEDIRDAPGSARYVTDRAVPIRAGASYVIRSRTSGRCTTFAKVQPLQVDVAAGTVQLRYAASLFCGDTRLFAED
jgi:hypothetical protein